MSTHWIPVWDSPKVPLTPCKDLSPLYRHYSSQLPFESSGAERNPRTSLLQCSHFGAEICKRNIKLGLNAAALLKIYEG